MIGFLFLRRLAIPALVLTFVVSCAIKQEVKTVPPSQIDPGLLEARKLALKPPLSEASIKQASNPISGDVVPLKLPPQEIQRLVLKLLPKYVKDRDGWATDIQVPFTTLGIEPSSENICSAIAVIEQESSFNANPAVPNLPKIALNEIYARASKRGIPNWAVNSALSVKSKTGASYLQRIQAAHTEGELSDIFEDMTESLPLGKTLFSSYNPIRTAGAMQVSIAFATSQVKNSPYPYPIKDGLRKEIFTRRGGLYFGIAHLLAYQAAYDAPIYRFADYNAGRYTSRNAAFQNALTVASGIPIEEDGDLLNYEKGDEKPSATQQALRSISQNANLSQSTIADDLRREKEYSFYETQTYNNLFSLAERVQGRPLKRAVIPKINLQGPKIQRKLTTAWFADRVNSRMVNCLLRQ